MIKAAQLDNSGHVISTVMLDDLNERQGFVLCPDHVGIGMSVTDPDPDQSIAARISQVNEIAQNHIFAIVPQWQQANLTARSAELLKLRMDHGTWTTIELAEVAAIDAIWEKVKAVRAYSNTLGNAISGGGNPDLHAGWPY